MTAVTFDTLKFAARLETGGFSSAQSKVFAEALSEAVNETAVTPEHLDLRLAELKSELKLDNAEKKAETLKWFTGILLAQAALIVAAVKLV